MSIISNGGRRSWKIRLIFVCMYTILLLGSVTMVYPFMLTLSSSVTDKFDFDDFVILPKYVCSNDALMKKYLFEKYGQLNFQSLAYTYSRDNVWINWNNIRSAPDFIKNTYAVR
jgi:hypothetical protein